MPLRSMIFPRSAGREDIAPALAATAAGVADGQSPSIKPPLWLMFAKILDVLETAHRLGRGLSPADDGS